MQGICNGDRSNAPSSSDSYGRRGNPFGQEAAHPTCQHPEQTNGRSLNSFAGPSISSRPNSGALKPDAPFEQQLQQLSAAASSAGRALMARLEVAHEALRKGGSRNGFSKGSSQISLDAIHSECAELGQC